jgi:ribonuclease BN (tRNA processing enzyme)
MASKEAIVEITVMGSGTAVPDAARGSPGIALQSDGWILFLDCGSGTLYRGARFGVPVDQVDFVLLSHLHPDHTGDLVPLLFAFRNPELPREKDLIFLGPEGIQRFFRDLEAVYGDWIHPRGYRLEIRSLKESEVLPLGPWRLRTFAVPHGPPSLAYEIADSAGRRLVYSGDTEYFGPLADFAREAELLILECSFPEGGDRPGHLTPSQAGRIAREAGCGRLLLTHFYPACRGQDLLTPCREQFLGPVLLGEDGLKVTV